MLTRTHFMADSVTDPDGLKAINAALRAAGIKYVRVEPVSHIKGRGYVLRTMYGYSRAGFTVHRPKDKIYNEHRRRNRYRVKFLDTSLSRVGIDDVVKTARRMDPHPELYSRYARALGARETSRRNDALAALADRDYSRAAKSAELAKRDAERAAAIRREVTLAEVPSIA